jgi:spore coat protein U-like protein
LYVGAYVDAFTGTHTRLDYRYNEVLLGLGTYPTSCTSGGFGGTGTFPFTARASVQPSCTVSASDHDFGNVGGFLDSSHDGTSAISLQCTNGAAWKVGLDNGQHASGATRRMSGSGGLVTYELYRDNGRTQRWGNAEQDWSTGTGSGTTQNLTVYGRVPAQQARPAGTYTDVVTVSVTY